MALLRRVDLYLNNARTPGNVLLTSLSDSSAPSAPAWIEDDKFLLRLRFCDLPTAVGGSATPTSLEADNVVAVAGKKTRGTGARLFQATNFVKVTAGGDDVYYQAVLNLNTVALGAAWGAGESQMAAKKRTARANTICTPRRTGNLMVNTAEDGYLALPSEEWVKSDVRSVVRERGTFEAEILEDGGHGDVFDACKLALHAIIAKGDGGRAEAAAAGVGSLAGHKAARPGLQNPRARRGTPARRMR